MRIATYNRELSKTKLPHQILSLCAYSFLADETFVCTMATNQLIIYQGLDRAPDSYIIDELLKSNLSDLIRDDIKLFIEIQKEINKAIKDKRRDKPAINLISRGKWTMKKYRKYYKDRLEAWLQEIGLLQLGDLRNSNIWTMGVALYNTEPDKEDPYISLLTKTITENEYLLAFDSVVEDMFSFALYNSDNEDEADFIKLPLCEFPTFEGINFLQFQCTFNEIRPDLIPFTEQFWILQEQLFQKAFTPENKREIKQLCSENILKYIEPFQEAINKSIYLSLWRNKPENDKGIKFCLGITSAENLVNYYERTEMIEPYVATEIKQQIGRQMDLKASCFFVYCTF